MRETVLIMLGTGLIFALIVILLAVIDEYLHGNNSQP